MMDEASLARVARRIEEAMEPILREQHGAAPQSQWTAEDGYVVMYTTGRVIGGPHDGKFLTQLFKPMGKGARTGKAQNWVECYRRQFSTRKAAKKRAIELYREHSPKWAEKHPAEGKS